MALARGCFNESPSGKPVIHFRHRDREVLRTLADVLGVFGSNEISEHTNTQKLNRVQGYKRENFGIATMAHHNITERRVRPINYSLSRVAAKSLITLGGAQTEFSHNHYKEYSIGVRDVLRDKLKQSLSMFNPVTRRKENGHDRVVIHEPQDFYEYADVEWPVGWWNERYLD